jgi:hypothetical protein
MQVTQILAVESSENEINLLFLIRDVAEGREVRAEILYWDHRASRVYSDRPITWSIRNNRVIRLCRKHIIHLSITEEKHDARLQNVLEDEVLIIITDLDNIR